MRTTKIIGITLVCLVLTACVSNLLFGNKMQSKLMWALFKPLVGFDPNEVNLLEKPMIKDRMTALLGDKYEPTMKLLKTADEIQQEGALFYIASRYAPKEVKGITDKAAMVWNADTNQMAVMVIKNGTPEIISEQIAGAKEAIVPILPKEVQVAYDKAVAAKKAVDEAKKSVDNMQESFDDIVSKKAAGNMIKKKIEAVTPPLKDSPIDEHLNSDPLDEKLKEELLVE